jgi:hypothetical protein
VLVAGTNFTAIGQFKFALVAKPAGASVWSNDATSADGSEPVGAIAPSVRAGLFTVLLASAAAQIAYGHRSQCQPGA